MTEIPASLEERVAALEDRLAYPSMLARAPEVSDEEAEEFRAGWRELLATPGVRLLPPAPVITPETAGALLRECVAVVKPGETLVIRIPDTWGPQQVYETQRRLSEIIAGRELGFTVLLVPGEEFAVAKPGRDPAAIEKHVEGILPALVVKELHRQMSQAMHQGRRRPGAPDFSRLRVNGVTMPRQKSPDSKDVTMSIRVSEAEAAEIDAARGGADRGTWLRDVALAAVRNSRAPRPAAVPREVPAVQVGTASKPKRDPKTCRHAGMRLHRGWCADCETIAVKK